MALSNFDRFKDSIAQVVQALIKPVDYFALYPCKVVKQRADYTLDLKPDSARVAAPVQVPIRTIPGIRVKVNPGDRVLLGFEGGSPSAPYAQLFEYGGSVVKIEIDAQEIVLNGGVKKVARDTDPVSIGVLTGVVPLPTPTPGTPVVFTLLPTGTLPPPGAAVLDGAITDGASGVKA